MTQLYYTKPEERIAILNAESILLKEDGYLFLGANSAFRDTLEYILYRKIKGNLVPVAFVFSVDLHALVYPGTMSGVSNSMFKEDEVLYENYLKSLLSLVPEGLFEFPMDYFESLGFDSRSSVVQKITKALNDLGYIAHVGIGDFIILNYQGSSLLTSSSEASLITPLPFVLKELENNHQELIDKIEALKINQGQV